MHNGSQPPGCLALCLLGTGPYMREHYDKLVRDRIPYIIQKNGQRPFWEQYPFDSSFCEILLKKLQEEVDELKKSGIQPNFETLDEFADVLEVLYALADLIDAVPQDLEHHRYRRSVERGSFRKRIRLLYVDRP